jgi:hypothetical protein
MAKFFQDIESSTSEINENEKKSLTVKINLVETTKPRLTKSSDDISEQVNDGIKSKTKL